MKTNERLDNKGMNTCVILKSQLHLGGLHTNNKEIRKLHSLVQSRINELISEGHKEVSLGEALANKIFIKN